MQTRKLVIGFAALLALVVAMYMAWQAMGLRLADCSDNVKHQSQSSDGRYTATLFQRNCGATTDYSTIVSLRASNSDFDGVKDTRVLVLKGSCEVTVHWQNDVLSLSYPRLCEIYKQLDSWRNVRIEVKST